MTNKDFENVSYQDLKIEIKCRAADLLPIDAIEDFQGNLKKRKKQDVDKIIRSIIEYGFSFPFYVWKDSGTNKCIDGHGRIAALCEMRKRGTNIPLLPVAYIDADDEQQAKQKLLRLNSQFGFMTMDSVVEFADGMEINGEELSLGFEVVDVKKSDIEESEKETLVKENDKPYRKVNILLSMSQDVFLEISEKLKKIKDEDGVEYVQSEN